MGLRKIPSISSRMMYTEIRAESIMKHTARAQLEEEKAKTSANKYP